MKNQTDEDWRKKLTPQQYRVLREKGTEAPFTGQLLNNKESGMYVCAACGQELFSSDAKYNSTTPGLIGWPSFSEAIDNDVIELRKDNTGGMQRIEVTCKKCGGHLGHVFDEESSQSGKHYCINSCALDFKKAG